MLEASNNVTSSQGATNGFPVAVTARPDIPFGKFFGRGMVIVGISVGPGVIGLIHVARA